MAKAKPKRQNQELDSVYVLKLVLYAVIGMQWLHLKSRAGNDLPLPVGFLLGLGFAAHDHFQIDRKVEYALLVIALLIGFFAQVGVFITT